MVADTGTLDQPFGDRRGPVAGGRQPDPWSLRARMPSGTSGCT